MAKSSVTFKTLAADSIHIFGVLAEKRSSRCLARGRDRRTWQTGQLFTHADVSAFQIGPTIAFFRRMRWAFQGDVACLICRQHIVWNGLEVSAVFNRQAFDRAEFHFTAAHLLA